jgi:excisionase family DNA binding protein
MKSPFVDVKEVAEYLGVSKELVYKLTDPSRTPEDPLPAFRLGKKLKFRLESPEMQGWINRRFNNTQPQIVTEDNVQPS